MDLQVIIVDDDEMVVYLHKALLNKAGFYPEPVVAYTGTEALEYIKNNQNDHSMDFLLLLDINMPGMDGWDVLDKIQAISLANRVYTIIVTSSVNKSDKEKASTYNNIIGFLEKPVNAEGLLKVKEIEAISKYFDDA